MIYHVTLGERSYEVELGPDGVSVDGRHIDVDLERVDGDATRSLIVDGASHRLTARRIGRETWDLHLRGRRLRADVVDERTRVIREMTGGVGASHGPEPIKAPMPGMVVKVEVEEGEVVQEGQGVVIVEAMKMENELSSPIDGVVAEVAVREGDTVEAGAALFRVEPAEKPSGG
jgi:biotin carboxyl carrier protein